MYSEVVRRLVAQLPNQGVLPDSSCGRTENPVCGDVVEIYSRSANGVIEEVRFQAAGCPAAIAGAAAVTLLSQGKSKEEALALTVEEVLDFLHGLPPHKKHGAEMALRALSISLGRAAGEQ